MHELIWAFGYLAVLVALAVLARRLGTFLSVALFSIVTIAWLRLGFDPAIPMSALLLYLAVFVVAVLLYVTSSEEKAESFWRPLRRVMVEPAWRPVLLAVLVLVPAVVAWRAYAASLPKPVPPPRIRTVHPANPSTVSLQPPGAVEATTIDIAAGHNPYRHVEETDPAEFAAKVAHGKVVYYENCFFCHGDTLEADGHFAPAVKPPPANFQDKGVLPQFTEGFFFWRIAKGGPGLPEEATPFDSSMPVWEKFLTEDDIWAVTLFLYDYTGTRPRVQETLHETGDTTAPAGEGH